jgi:hypothetical protein
MATFEVQLRRMETSQPWGFRLRGGTDQGVPLHVEHVQPKGRAAHSGVLPGDRVLAICGVSTQSMTHDDVKREMLRAGNELDITLFRDGAVMVQSAPAASPHTTNEPRSEIDEQPIPKLGGPTFKQVKPKTYQVLEEQLHSPDEVPTTETTAAKPSSIFDRKREERSDYLKAKGPTIQKAYGERP